MIRQTKAEKVFDIMNQLLKPLPRLAQSLSSTLFLQLVPIFFIYAMNVTFLGSERVRNTVVYYMISFAIGGLLGDVFFHTLPHLSSGGHGHDHHHSHEHGHGGHGHAHSEKDMFNNLIIIGGIVAFFLLEKIVNQMMGGDGHEHSHSHSHSHKESVKEEK